VYKHKPSAEGINKVLNHFSIKNHEAIYIGDKDIDYLTAKNANIDFLGVSWGMFSQKINTIDYGNFINTINSKKK
jgi:phosphoglycolate phosphatase